MADRGAEITALGYALLGQISIAPRSGYALRMVFETTPLGAYSSSPGSIYPALKSLAAKGLVRTAGPGRGARYELTTAGAAALDGWLRAPVTAEEVTRRLDLQLLRFALLTGHPDRSLTQAFLRSFEAATAARAAELRGFLEAGVGAAMPLQARLAVEHGQQSLETSARWAAESWRRLTAEQKGGVG
ncbi:MAG: PadR family transcriptional regulator [Brevundimonas sp.]